MIIEANITIDVDGDFNIDVLTKQLETILGDVNGLPTDFNIVQMDNPISTSPLNYRVGV